MPVETVESSIVVVEPTRFHNAPAADESELSKRSTSYEVTWSALADGAFQLSVTVPFDSVEAKPLGASCAAVGVIDTDASADQPLCSAPRKAATR